MGLGMIPGPIWKRSCYIEITISARVSSRDPHISPRRSRGMIAGMIWKISCINLFIIYFRQLFYEANKQNEIIKRIYMEA
jgi:hypothetical protein